MLKTQRRSEAADLRAIRPTRADIRANPDVDLMADWLQTVEDAIARRISWGDLAPEDAAEFRAIATSR